VWNLTEVSMHICNKALNALWDSQPDMMHPDSSSGV
jgi:hypothetical protein